MYKSNKRKHLYDRISLFTNLRKKIYIYKYIYVTLKAEQYLVHCRTRSSARPTLSAKYIHTKNRQQRHKYTSYTEHNSPSMPSILSKSPSCANTQQPIKTSLTILDYVNTTKDTCDDGVTHLGALFSARPSVLSRNGAGWVSFLSLC